MKKIISSRLPRFRIYAFLISTVVLSFSHPEANATVIFYEVQNLGGTTWEYSYTVENDTLGSDIEEFTIYFDLGLYENLVVVSTPADWDPLVIEPDANIPDDGFYDALALSAGISGGNT